MANPLSAAETSIAVESVAHIVQVALTPVFLLSGIGNLLSVFNTRLTRVSDHTEQAADLLLQEPDVDRQVELIGHLVRLQRRRLVLDASVILGAIGGSSTCFAAVALFLGGLRDTAVASWLYVFFGVALGCTVLALMAFLIDSVLAWHGLRREGPLPRSVTPAKPG